MIPVIICSFYDLTKICRHRTIMLQHWNLVSLFKKPRIIYDEIKTVRKKQMCAYRPLTTSIYFPIEMSFVKC